MVGGLEHLSCEHGLGGLGLFSLEGRAPGRPYRSLPYKGSIRWREKTEACSDMAGHDGFKQKDNRFGLSMRRKFFAVGVVRCWIRLCEVVDATSLHVFRVRLNGTLGNLVQ